MPQGNLHVFERLDHSRGVTKTESSSPTEVNNYKKKPRKLWTPMSFPFSHNLYYYIVSFLCYRQWNEQGTFPAPPSVREDITLFIGSPRLSDVLELKVSGQFTIENHLVWLSTTLSPIPFVIFRYGRHKFLKGLVTLPEDSTFKRSGYEKGRQFTFGTHVSQTSVYVIRRIG